MAPRDALSRRRLDPLTPLIAAQWEKALAEARLLALYPTIPMYIRHGAHAGIPRIFRTYAPSNSTSTEILKEVFNSTIEVEFSKG